MPRWFHCIRVLVFACAAAAPAAGAAQPPTASSATTTRPSRLLVLVRSVQIGTEESTVTRTAQGWTIASTGRLGPPVDVTARRLEIKYDADWKPLELHLEGTQGTQPITLRTVVTGTSARNEFTNAVAPGERTDTIAEDALLLPSPFFAPYEALAGRLRTAAPGTTIQLYTAPLGLLTATVGESTTERLQTVSRLIELRRTQVQLAPAGAAAVDAEVWADENGRLLRLRVPSENVEVVREDIRAVSTRRVTITRAGDEAVQIPANGFSLAGTVSAPAGATGPRPAVVLVGGAGPTDRDETLFGIPIFGQLAGILADAGFLVVRYDKRGVGQSGGRPESATLQDYADDLRAVVRYVGDRKDVDDKRIAVLGHGEGGPVAMIAGAQENRIKALVMVAAVGVTGAEWNMAEVERALARSSRPDEEKGKTLALQRKIQAAVTTGKGWEEIPPALRRQADTPWFQSFLTFDPAKPMANLRQPLLIVQGALDTQVPPANAERLEQLAKARKRQAPVDVVTVPGANHLLVRATTGEVDEYPSLGDQTVSPDVTTPIIDWLTRTFAQSK